MGTTASAPLAPTWTRRHDADGVLHWVSSDTTDDTPLAFVAQWKSPIQWTRVQDANARAALPLNYALTDDDVARAKGSFQEKYAWYQSQLAALRTPWRDGHLKMRVRRQNLLLESMEQLLGMSDELMRMTMLVELIDELMVPEGEWLSLLVEQLFDESLGLFVRSRGDMTRWTIYAHSDEASADHLLYFRAVGRLVGRALLGGLSLKTHVARPLLQVMLGTPITLTDVEQLDPDAYEMLLKLQSTNENVEELGLFFSVTTRTLGSRERRTVDLIEGGREVPVTAANKAEYIERLMHHVVVGAFAPQLERFVQGLVDIIPIQLLLPFTPDELDRVLFDPPPPFETKEDEERDPLKTETRAMSQVP